MTTALAIALIIALIAPRLACAILGYMVLFTVASAGLILALSVIGLSIFIH